MSAENAISSFKYTVAGDLKNLEAPLKKSSRDLCDVNTKIMQQLLLLDEANIGIFLRKLLSHLLHINQIKDIQSSILNITGKVINFLSNYEKQLNTSLEQLLYHILDIISVLMKEKDRFKVSDLKTGMQKNQSALKIVQNIFSLVNKKIINSMEYNLLIRLYSIFFDSCIEDTLIQNIAVSGLLAMTQILFQEKKNLPTYTKILQGFLQYIFQGKQFNWLSNPNLKGLVWDLIVIAIKNCKEVIWQMHRQCLIYKHIKTMYQIALQHVLASGQQYNILNNLNKKKQKQSNTIQPKKNTIADFIRFYRAFIFYSLYLCLEASSKGYQPLVSFSQYMLSLAKGYTFNLSNKDYIFLEGICYLLINKEDMLYKDEQGQIIIDILLKISNQLVLADKIQKNVNESNDFFIEKFCGEFSKIAEGDFVKLIKFTIVTLRKKLGQNQLKVEEKDSQDQPLTQRSQISNSISQDKGTKSNRTAIQKKRRWEKSIRQIIKIIKYLSCINFVGYDEELMIRQNLQILLEYQHWFLVTKLIYRQLSNSHKTQNIILQQLLLVTSSVRNNQQLQKACQCIQIGSNLMYGYYDSFDTTGIGLIIKMLAGVKCQIIEGSASEELIELMQMCQKLYQYQKLIKNKKAFTRTIQGFIQCSNGIIADMQQPSQIPQSKQKKASQKKFLNMVAYIVEKITTLLIDYKVYLDSEWPFITGFFLTLCLSKRQQLKELGMKNVLQLIKKLLQSSKQTNVNDSQEKQMKISQNQILSFYIQLSRSKINVSENIIDHMKQILEHLGSSKAIIEVFKIVKNVSEKKVNRDNLNQLQEILIKEKLYSIREITYLKEIIENIINQEKQSISNNNQEYNLANILWGISDHLKQLLTDNKIQDKQPYCQLMISLLGKFQIMYMHTTNLEFKQAIIHSLTQIMAENIITLKKETILNLYNELYLPLLADLMGVKKMSKKVQRNQSVAAQDIQREILQLIKIAIKNFLKLTKKLIIEKVLQKQNSSPVDKIFGLIIDYLTQCINQSQTTQERQYQLTEDVIYQYFVLIQKCIEQPYHPDFYSRNKMRDLFLKLEQAFKIVNNQSICFKKRLTPLFQELKYRHFKQLYSSISRDN